MIQNMLLGGGGGSGGSAEINSTVETAISGKIGFQVDGMPTWFLLYAVSGTRPTESSGYHLVMAYGEVDSETMLHSSTYSYSNNCYYISYYGAVSLKDKSFVEYWYEDGWFYLGQYDNYYRMPENANYVLCYTT